MKTTFIEDYLENPGSAVAKASQAMAGKWYDEIDDELIYRQISTPEFRLYEEVALSVPDMPASVAYSTY